jgi:predicted MPP superfamily phosphohydrolase
MQRRTFIKRGLATAAFLGCGGTSLAYADDQERHGVQVTTVPLHLGLTRPLRAALLADIHFDPYYETGYLGAVFRMLAASSPDIVFYAGDYVTHTTARFEEFGLMTGSVRPPLGSFAALGNHDHWSGRAKIRQVLEENGIRVLRNAVVPLPGNPGWALAGLDSFWAGRPDAGMFAREPADTQFISIVHEPDAWDTLTDPRIRLQVSGHTHGGQIRAPFIGAIELPSWGKKYDAGLFRRGDQCLYVNRGIGTVKIRCRLNCRPEITLLELS